MELARKNPNNFNELCLFDIHTGNPIRQHIIHLLWNAHVDWCIENKINAGILAPFGHGKTEQLIIGRTLHDIGNNPNLRIKIVCNIDDNAVSRVMAIRKQIEENPKVKELFPNLIPEKRKFYDENGKEVREGKQAEIWNNHALNVKRTIISKDNSIEAWGVTSSVTGGRCDRLLFDDPVDYQNAIAAPAMRIKIKDIVRNVWFSRPDKDGFILYVATIWAEDDLTSDLMYSKGFCFLKMAIDEELSCIECEVNADETHPLNRWEELKVIRI